MTLVFAACGGDSAATTTTTVVAGGDGATTPTTTSAPATVDPGSGTSTDFCQFITEYAEDAELSPLGISAAEFEERFRANLAAIEMAADIAPSEVADDVNLFVGAFRGFVELLDEYDFNFLAMGDQALNDPRLTALDNAELEAAGDRIEAFCGFEPGEFITPGSPDDGEPGGTVEPGVLGTELPEGFPEGLVPPNGQVVASVSIGGATSVTFDIEGVTDDVIAFYTAELGPPVTVLPQPKGALWASSVDGATLSVVVAETGPGMVQVNVTIG